MLRQKALRIGGCLAILLGLCSAANATDKTPSASAAPAQTPIAFGVQTQFSQGKSLRQYDVVESYGTNIVRDGVQWHLIEVSPGEYDFDHKRVAYIGELLQQGADPILVFQTKGPDFYNDGDTVYIADHIQAFADYVVATLDHFEGVRRIEIGNEINGGDKRFVSGPARGVNLNERAANYARILKTVYPVVKAAHPDVQIIGGATLELPVGFMAFLREHGAMDHMDAFSFHPYRSTDAEGLGAQIRHMQTETGDLPLYATEFGKAYGPDHVAKVPGHMVKMMAMMGDAGVAEAIWYQLRDREAKSRALQSLDGAGRPAAVTFEFLNKVLLAKGNPVRLGVPLPIYLFRYGTDTYVIWGSRQAVSVTGENLQFRDAMGREIAPIQQISNEPVIVSGTNVGLAVTLSEVAGDSYFQYNLFNADDMSPWAYFAVDATGTRLKAAIQGGQQRRNAGYTPYVASPNDRWGGYRVDHHRVQPDQHYAVAEQFSVPKTGTYSLDAKWRLHPRNKTGVSIAVTINGQAIEQFAMTDPDKAASVSRKLTLQAGDKLDFVVDADGDDISDIVFRRFIISREIAPGEATAIKFDDLKPFFTKKDSNTVPD